MKPAFQWARELAGHIDGLRYSDIEAVQEDARADLLERIKVLEAENSALKPNLQQMTVDAHQAHKALKLALGALGALIAAAPHSGEGLQRALACHDGRTAIEAIKACGVGVIL